MSGQPEASDARPTTAAERTATGSATKCLSCAAAEARADTAEAQLRAQGWQPIEPAPNDESVLTLRGAGLIAAARRIWCCTDGCELINVTHWAPLPAPPITKESQP